MGEQHVFSVGDTVLLHCKYDTSEVRDRITYMGVDERTHEMCNQYFMATESMRLGCSSRSLTPARSFASAFSVATAGMPAGGMGQMTGLAHDEKAGRIYAIHRAQNNFMSTTRIGTAAIVAFSYTGAIQAYLCKDTFVVPHGLSLDHHGALWATDVALHQVLRIDPSGIGEVTLRLGTAGKPGKGATAFNKPTDVAVHRQSNEVYVADGYGNSRVAVFTYDGLFLREFGQSGSLEGQFRVPHSIVIDRRGLVYVADRENSRVQIFDADGTFKDVWVSRASTAIGRSSYAHHASSISYSDALDLFVLSEGDATVVRTPSGCDIMQSAQMLRWPHDAVILPAATDRGQPSPNRSGLASDGEFVVYVAELDGKRMTKFAKGTWDSSYDDDESSPYGRQLLVEEAAR